MGIANAISQIIKDKGITTESEPDQSQRRHQDSSEAEMPLLLRLVDVMSDRASTMPISTISSISMLEIIGEESRMDEVDDNRPVEYLLLVSKRTAEDVPTLKKKLRASPNSLSSDLTELSQCKREQMNNDTRHINMQFGIEDRKLKLLEKESEIKMEKLKAKADHECLKLDTPCMKFIVELLCQQVQLLKEGVSQDDIDSFLPIVND